MPIEEKIAGGQHKMDKKGNLPPEITEDMERKIKAAKETPDADCPIHTNQDVLRYYAGER